MTTEELFDELYHIVKKNHVSKNIGDDDGKRANDIASELNKLGFSDSQIGRKLDFRYMSEKTCAALRRM